MSKLPSAQGFGLAVFFIIAGYFGYSVADLLSKMLQDRYSIYQVLTVSGIGGLLVTGVWLSIKYGWKAFFPPRLHLHVLRAFFVTATAYFMVRSLQTLPLADFYGIVFSMPFIVMVLSILLLDEQVGWRRWMATGFGFCGVLILAGPQFETIGEGFICALLGAFCAACNIIAIRKIGRGLPSPLYGFYPFLGITLFHGAGLLLTGSYISPRPEDIPFFIAHGPVVVLAITLVSLGYSKATETAVVAPFQYTQLIWGVAFGWMFFDDLPTAATWAGLTIIIGAGLYSLWREHQHHIKIRN